MANIALADFTIDSDGNLVISKIPGIAYRYSDGYIDTYDQEYQEIDAMNVSDDNKFAELIEYQICNGYGYSDASWAGHLSEAPIIWDDANCKMDVNEYEEDIPLQFWYDNMYMIRSAWSEFLDTGKVTFLYFDTTS